MFFLNIFKMWSSCLLFVLVLIFPNEGTKAPPNIVFIIVDDMGWNDIGFHGSNQIPTPNIDALAYSGVILNNYYVSPICTPSRSALMTGKYPIHTGMQHTVLYGAEPRGLPLTEKLLPQYLEELGYVNRIVGKWHLGSWKKEYTPLYRGFVSHLGFWTGHQDLYDHTAVENPGWGLDMRENMSVAYSLHGKYSTDLFTDESVRLINAHDTSKPLFLYLAHGAPHSGNPYEPLRAPDDDIAKFKYIEDYQRSKYAAMMSKIDESVGKVVKALKNRGMLQNSLVIFTTDNGGAAAGFNLNAASNWPLKGVKNTLWEGGVRGAALLWSPLLKKPHRVSDQMMHISDWLPTLLEAVGYNTSALSGLDGMSIWKSLSENITSPRTEILHNIDDIYGNAALTVGQWKVLTGTTYAGAWDNYYGPSGRNYSYNISNILLSPANLALKSIAKDATAEQMNELRQEAFLQRCNNSTLFKDGGRAPCFPMHAPCLFNILEDPCEYNNLADVYPEILSDMLVTLKKYNDTAVLPGNLPLDPRGDPKYYNYVFTNFGDYIDS